MQCPVEIHSRSNSLSPSIVLSIASRPAFTRWSPPTRPTILSPGHRARTCLSMFMMPEWLHPDRKTTPLPFTLAITPMSSIIWSGAGDPSLRVKNPVGPPSKSVTRGISPVVARPSVNGKGSLDSSSLPPAASIASRRSSGRTPRAETTGALLKCGRNRSGFATTGSSRLPTDRTSDATPPVWS